MGIFTDREEVHESSKSKKEMTSILESDREESPHTIEGMLRHSRTHTDIQVSQLDDIFVWQNIFGQVDPPPEDNELILLLEVDKEVEKFDGPTSSGQEG